MSPQYVAIVAVGASLVGAFTTFLTKYLPNRADRVSAAAILSAAAINLIEPQAEQLEAIQTELVELRSNQVQMLTEIRKLKLDIEALTQQVVDLGHIPVTHL